MKKITLFAIAFVGITFASCKKDYTCTCTVGAGTSVTKLVKVSKKAAQANCVSGTTTAGAYAYVQTCTLTK